MICIAHSEHASQSGTSLPDSTLESNGVVPAVFYELTEEINCSTIARLKFTEVESGRWCIGPPGYRQAGTALARDVAFVSSYRGRSRIRSRRFPTSKRL